MSIGFYMDVHVPLAITEQLRERQIDVLVAQDDGARRFSDPDLLDRASGLGCILVTQDEDLLAEATLRQRTGRYFVGIVFAPQTGVTIGQCVENLELLSKATKLTEWGNRVEYLPLR